MQRYQTLLCLGISLSTLSGCGSYFNEPQEHAADSQSCPTAAYVDSEFHLTASNEYLTQIDHQAISQALIQKQHMLHYVMAACQAAKVPSDIALIPLLDSQYQNTLTTNNNTGIWQLSPTMAQNLSLTNGYWFDARQDLQQSTDAVIAYMQFLHTTLGNDWTLALTAYHTGLQPVLDAVNTNKRMGKDISLDALPIDADAKAYTTKLQAVLQVYRHNQDKLDETITVKHVDFPGQLEIDQLAKVAEIDPLSLEEINSGFKRHLSDPDGPHQILVQSTDYKALKTITHDASKLRQVSKSNWNYHIVSPNESLSVIAHNFDTSVAEIKRVNHLKNDIIRVNQKLLIPEHTHRSAPKETIGSINQFSPEPQRIVHTVKKKETLYHISQKYHVDIDNIVAWNNLESPAIRPNQTIVVWKYTPADTAHFYTVKVNDSLTKIARDHRVSLKALKDANQLKSNIIHPQDRLVIPSVNKG
ncbi:lytic transglycosylase [Candidatus Synchoanobacter obligatus]|uniref:LysM peptidoglycan-binding domain-containing protein n=1 Tax=Candidatus Synchoanobacter obligatus TaxID=2919597 RepID=A0ABT1L5L9_9GAMM|nr:LysM peptidoglycan-binding domain-containing protein [Candidatus Synchoanobacter obligatus]MCP8352465.1 LysM peptidoglycan-binding domain-containing protein [Candidatus Synchoanobacter obligatus]